MIAQQLRDALGVLLHNAQQAHAVRPDVSTADVIAVLTGASLAMRYRAADADIASQVLTVICDGLRADR